MIKKTISAIYILVLVIMAAATIVEKSQGTDYVHTHYYGAWWFALLWAVLAVLGVFYILQRKVRTASTLALHLSFHPCGRTDHTHICASRHDTPARGTAHRHLCGKRWQTRHDHREYSDVRAGNTDRVNIFFDKMKKYQQVSGGNSLPSSVQYRAERILNGFPFATILFMVNLTLGFIALLYTIYRITRQRSLKAFDIALPALLGISFLALTFGLAMRWIVSSNVPMSNGYESMLTVAWFVMLISLVMQWRIRLVMVFGFLLSGFFLLVSHINQMDPAIGQMMPVLNSPLLSIHVSIIMMSYALLSLTFLCGVMGIFLRSHGEELQALSRVFLYPALATMGFGIFIGAIWANVSWGNYWSWDSKETWALITFMIYAVVAHTQSLPLFRKPLAYHVYMTLAFLSIVMTYFGVNYFLTGMHSYA